MKEYLLNIPADIMILSALLLFLVFLAVGFANLKPPTIQCFSSTRTNIKEDKEIMKVTLKNLKTYDDMNGQILVELEEFTFEGERRELDTVLEGLNIKQ